MSLNQTVSTVWGCRTGARDSGLGRRSELESSAIEGESPVFETEMDTAGT